MAAEQSGVGSWMDSCPVLRAEGDVEGHKGHLSVARLTPGTCTYIPRRDGVCRPQLEPSRDVRIILPFHTLSCFSLNYNCFLHNEKPAQE